MSYPDVVPYHDVVQLEAGCSHALFGDTLCDSRHGGYRFVACPSL